MTSPVLVVGGGSGIGRQIVNSLIRQGDEVVVVDKDISYWNDKQKLSMKCFEADVLDINSLTALVVTLCKISSSFKGFVFTVGVALTMPVSSLKPTNYLSLLNLNTMSFCVLTNLLESNNVFDESGASIVVISSLVGSIGAKGKTAYSASKGALDSAIKCMAIEYAEKKIRVNAIAPGTVRTEMLTKLIQTIGCDAVNELESEYPLGLGSPEDIADCARYLISDKSPGITGTVFMIDGGFSAR